MMEPKHFLTILCFFLVCSFTVQSQTLMVSGRVIDDDTEEGIPFCNIFIQGTTIGVASDFDGYFSFEYSESKPNDTLVVSAIGYVDRKRPLGSEIEQTFNFRMRTSDFDLAEVVVVAGENPANEIVRNIVKNKPKNDVRNLSNYQCESYQKVELDLDNIDKMQDRKLLKQFDFVFDNIDSTSDEKPFLPGYISETMYDVYHVKDEPLKEIPKAMQVSGVNNTTVIDFLNTMHEKYSIYDNWIYILGKEFISPFAGTGLRYYDYYIQDTMMISGQRSIKLKFKPKRKQENTFYGNFWVVDSTFTIHQLNMRMSPGVNINLVNRIIIYDESNWVNDSIWMPTKQKVVVDFVSTKNAPGLIARQTTTFKDYKINQEEIIDRHATLDPEDFYIGDMEKGEEYWIENRHEDLSKNEAIIYSMIDSIKQVPVYKTYSKILTFLGSGWWVIGPVELGQWSSFYSGNDVEGSRLRLAMGTSNNLSTRIRFEVFGAYGFKDKEFKYGGKMQWNVRKGKRRTIVGLAYKDDVELSNMSSEEFGDANVFTSLPRSKNIQQKILAVTEAKGFIDHDWKKGWSNKLTYIYRQMDPYGGQGYGFDYQYLPRPVADPTRIDTTVTASEFIFKTRYAYKEKILQGNFDRISLGTKYPIVSLQYTAGVKGVLKSDYNYHKLTLGIEHWFYINPIGWSKYIFKTGKTFGALPFLLLEVHPGNETYFYSDENFNLMNRFEFVSDSYASLMWEHHFDGFFFNKIPGVRKLKLRLVGSFKAVVGKLSTENRLNNQLNFIDSPDGYVVGAPGKVPYMESGFGIENILRFIRIDAMWRLNYLGNPEAQKFVPMVSLDFNF